MIGNDAELLFDVLTPIWFHVHVTREYWELIVRVKHPAVGREVDIQDTLRDPDTIRVSRVIQACICSTSPNEAIAGFVR